MSLFSRRNLRYLIVYVLLFSLPLVLMPKPAWLLAQQEEADKVLEQGKQLFMEGLFKEAIEKLALAIKMLSNRDKLIDAYLHLSLSHFALGDRDRAKEDLSRLLRLNPAQELDPLYYPPDFIELLDEAKEVVLARIKVETEPADAQVYLGAELIGVTPLNITEVAAGDHKIKVIKEGYKAYEESFIVKKGEEKTISIELEKEKERKPKVAVTPPEKKPEVKKGKRWLWILLGGAAVAAVAILAGKGGKEKAGPTQTPTQQTFGAIQVKSYPNGASIFLDGQDTSLKTNHTLTNISTGSHTILLRKSGWKDWEEQVTVQENQTAVVKPCLLPPNGCFRDSFQDGDADGWEFFDGGWKIKKEGGNYFLEEKSTPDIACNAKPQCGNRRNFSLKFRLKVTSLDKRKDEYFSISFRYANECFYSFNFHPYQTVCRIHILTTGEYYGLGDSTRSISKGQWYNIEIVAQGDNLQVLINNSLILNIHHHDERIGKGFILLSAGNGCHAQIDDVVIISEECP